MGKNKNKGFDLAKRQEKILKKMVQPLYKKPTDSVYLVITKPFGMHESPAARGTRDINRLSSWISWVFRRRTVLEAVYTMSTRDEVIIKIAEGLDVTLMLGKHRYRNILNQGWADPDAASCVFEYDYPNNGDPSAHSWREHIALDASAPPGHFRNPYPAPTWTYRPSELANLAHLLPDSVSRTPPPSPGPSSAHSNPTQEDAGRESRKRDETAAIKSSLSAPSSVKVEPSSRPIPSIKYEEPAYEPTQTLRDEVAQLNGSGLQANVRVEEKQVSEYGHGDTKAVSVKQEPRDVRSETLGPAIGPSQALFDEWSQLRSQQKQHIGSATPTKPKKQVSEYEHGDTQAVSVKQEPRDVQSETLGPATGPSQALFDEWSHLRSQQQQHIGSATPIKPEPDNLQSMARFPTDTQPLRPSGSREHTSREQQASFKIKRESTEDEQPWKRPKMEFN